MKRMKIGLALCAAMAFGGIAAAQPPQPVPGVYTLSPAERAALAPIKQAIDARDWAGASALIPAARAALRGNDARYVLARLELDIAIGSGNRAAQGDAISKVLETRRASADEQAELLRQYAGIAYDRGDLNAADGSLTRALQLAPEDPEILIMLAQLNRNRNNTPQALGFFQRATRAAATTGRRFPENRYRVALAMAEQSGQRPVALEIARNYIAAYPSPGNWRDALIVFRTVGAIDPNQAIDVWRLMRASGALAGERDWIAAAQAFDQAGLPAEAKAVLEEGTRRRMLSASDAAPRALLGAVTTRATRERGTLTGQMTQARAATATATQARTVADALLSHGRHAEAAEFYRLALGRVGEDPGLLNTRLGIALAMAGQRAEAEAALRAVSGPYAELAALWAIWLANRPAS